MIGRIFTEIWGAYLLLLLFFGGGGGQVAYYQNFAVIG